LFLPRIGGPKMLGAAGDGANSVGGGTDDENVLHTGFTTELISGASQLPPISFTVARCHIGLGAVVASSTGSWLNWLGHRDVRQERFVEERK
jgi:hypothetical protein